MGEVVAWKHPQELLAYFLGELPNSSFGFRVAIEFRSLA